MLIGESDAGANSEEVGFREPSLPEDVLYTHPFYGLSL